MKVWRKQKVGASRWCLHRAMGRARRGHAAGGTGSAAPGCGRDFRAGGLPLPPWIGARRGWGASLPGPQRFRSPQHPCPRPALCRMLHVCPASVEPPQRFRERRPDQCLPGVLRLHDSATRPPRGKTFFIILTFLFNSCRSPPFFSSPSRLFHLTFPSSCSSTRRWKMDTYDNALIISFL